MKVGRLNQADSQSEMSSLHVRREEREIKKTVAAYCLTPINVLTDHLRLCHSQEWGKKTFICVRAGTERKQWTDV